MLEAHPNLARVADKHGRLALHYAAGSSGVYETIGRILEANPTAASVRDPITGLYPFMLAGSSGNAPAAFLLLLADPNLVLDGAQADAGENDKKRKRIPSIG